MLLALYMEIWLLFFQTSYVRLIIIAQARQRIVIISLFTYRTDEGKRSRIYEYNILKIRITLYGGFFYIMNMLTQ